MILPLGPRNQVRLFPYLSKYAVMSSSDQEAGTQFSEISFSLPEFIDFARQSGDEATAIEFEFWHRRHGDIASVRLLIPNDPQKHPAIELIFS